MANVIPDKPTHHFSFFLLGILLLSIILNMWGIHWGPTKLWHPDEIIERTINMVGPKSINPHYFAYGGLHYYVLGAMAVIPAYIFGAVLVEDNYWQTVKILCRPVQGTSFCALFSSWMFWR